MKILIVEDDKVLSLLLSKMIQKMGFKVIGAVNQGIQALQYAREFKPDLILMDIMLEDDIDGIDVAQILQKEKLHIPIIFITGNSDVYNRTRVQKVKYIDYLVKPINFNILKKSIDKLILTNNESKF